uniref:Threonylcarbamoyl-AMP synthase n=1 Tax=Panagrellus redivivus TaxID=6233 RepID=A0A7E4W4V7_PANRE
MRLALTRMARIIELKTPADLEVAVAEAAAVLRSGGLVALPTDTIYGVSSLLNNTESIYRLKHRPHEKPLGLFVANVDLIHRFGKVGTVPEPLLDALLPGPVTLLFDRSDSLPVDFNPGASKVGFRVPDAVFVQRLAEQFPEQPIAQTSANMSGDPKSPLCIQDFEDLWPHLDLIIDAGPICQHNGNRDGSTIVDLSQSGVYEITRRGCAFDATTKTLERFGLKAIGSAEEPKSEVSTGWIHRFWASISAKLVAVGRILKGF